MAHRYISDLAPGELVENQAFLIASKDLRRTTNGSLYIHAVLADKTGQVLARVWQATEGQFKMMPEGGFLRFRGRTESYKGNLQFIIEGMDTVKSEELDMADYLPATEGNVDEMWERVKTILQTIKDRDLSNLVQAFVADEALMTRFQQAPAAVVLHHAYIGGLLEHTLNLLELAQVVIPRYPQLSLDLVLAGLFLHDLGKTKELTYETAFQYSDQGQLLGHIVQSVLWIDEKVREVEQQTGKPFDAHKKWVLQHVVLSHHGKPEFGSPKFPALPEAIAVHYLDNLDAKIYQYLRAIASDNDEEARWTEYVRTLETKVYKRGVGPG